MDVRSHCLFRKQVSIMGMMSLSLADGEEITVVTDGEDEQRAAEGIKTFFAKGRK